MSLARAKQPQVWALILVLLCGAIALAVFAPGGTQVPTHTSWWIWPLAIAGFAAGDATVVRVQLRSEVTAFTFLELPLFLAVIYLPPRTVLATLAVGVAISVFVVQRLPLMKAAFNVANLSLQGAVGLWIFHLVLQGADPVGPAGWLAAAVAGGISSSLGVCGVLVVLMLVQRARSVEGLGQTVFMSALTGVTNVSLALLAATLIAYRPLALVLLVLPTAVLFGSYRAYTSERAQRDRVQAMHELALEVRSIRNQAGLAPVLKRIAAHLGAAQAELVVFPDHRDGAHAMRFFVDGSEARITDVVSADLANVVDEVHALAVPELRPGNEIAGAIRGEGRSLGLLVIGGRSSGSAEFTADDLVMFGTIVEQLGLTFEKNQLGQAVTRLERHQRELQHEASHDLLTGIGNRALLAARLDEEISEHRRPTLLYVDLDDFKTVNDRFGHDAGDQVLVEVARRFASVIGPTDCVARLGGDEFAVLLGELADDIGIAHALLAAASEPIDVTDAVVHVNASIGLARARQGVDSATLLKQADVAMYDAKASGKGQMVIAAQPIEVPV